MDTLVLYPGIPSELANAKILGFSFLERFILSAKRNGFKNIVPLAQNPPLPLDFLVVYPDFLCSDSLWKEFKPSKDLKTPLSSKSLSNPQKNWVPFTSVEELPSVEKWLLHSLIKEEEGFMSKHFERKISLSFTKVLVRTGMTPNQMSLISIGIGIMGAGFFIFSQKWYDILGALLFWLHSVLDGCDGEIARLKFLESKLGGILDFWGDNVVHSAVFLFLAVGLSKHSNSMLPFLLASFAVGGTLFSAGFVYFKTMRKRSSDGPLFTSVTSQAPKNSLEKAVNFLARRDFIYLVIALAFLGRVDLFLWMGAIGSPIYFLVILFMEKRYE